MGSELTKENKVTRENLLKALQGITKPESEIEKNAQAESEKFIKLIAELIKKPNNQSSSEDNSNAEEPKKMIEDEAIKTHKKILAEFVKYLTVKESDEKKKAKDNIKKIALTLVMTSQILSKAEINKNSKFIQSESICEENIIKNNLIWKLIEEFDSKLNEKIMERFSKYVKFIEDNFCIKSIERRIQKYCSESEAWDSHISEDIIPAPEIEIRLEDEGKFLFIGMKSKYEYSLWGPFLIFFMSKEEEVYLIKSNDSENEVENYVIPKKKSTFVIFDQSGGTQEYEGKFDSEEKKFKIPQMPLGSLQELNNIINDYVGGVMDELTSGIKEELNEVHFQFVNKMRTNTNNSYRKRIELENGHFFGDINRGKRTGYGEYVLKGGTKYFIGEFDDGQMKSPFLILEDIDNMITARKSKHEQYFLVREDFTVNGVIPKRNKEESVFGLTRGRSENYGTVPQEVGGLRRLQTVPAR